MKVALAHDYLNQYGGAERVLEVLTEIFPEAPIYTLFYDPEKTKNRFRGKVAGTSFLDRAIVRENHRWFIPLMPLAAQKLKIPAEYDLVVSSSAGFGKGIGHSRQTRHISYCHTPLRYAWEPDRYFDWSPAVKSAAAPVFRYLRNWDKKAGQNPDVLLANSNFISGKIKKYYNREAETVYPPVDLKKFYKDQSVKRGDYFLAIGRLLPYKRFDLIVEAFGRLNLPLLIAGEGPEKTKLELKIKNQEFKNIRLISFVEDGGELRKLYSGARALIFPQTEDFGLVAAEAQACGCPVIAFSGGGALEIVRDEITGIFFRDQSAINLIEAVERFNQVKFNENLIAESASRFSKEKFKKEILRLVNQK